MAPAALKTRFRDALCAAALHFVLSAAVAGLTAFLVFGFWFPGSLRELVGGAELFWLVVGVDLVCGPLLTLVMFNPIKSRAELRRDLALVAVIQLLALGYGIQTLSYARPVALVHEVDRFRVIGFADLDEADAVHAPDWAKPWRLSRPRTVGIRAAISGQEQLDSIDASIQGIEPSQRPSWWQDYARSVPQVLQRARPLTELRAKHPAQAALLDTAVTSAIADAQPGETTDPNALRWLPLVSRRATNWVVLLDPVTARVRGYAHLDGF
ncbi:hypothetical protein B2J89_20175 [Acidovorax sp. SRB_24]|nr:hypothetical protein [Acidovorax sp. SRB_24]